MFCTLACAILDRLGGRSTHWAICLEESIDRTEFPVRTGVFVARGFLTITLRGEQDAAD